MSYFLKRTGYFYKFLFVFVVISMNVVMLIVLATTTTIPMKLINRAFHEYLDKLSLYDILGCSRRKRNTRILFVFCVDISALEEVLCDISRRVILLKGMREGVEKLKRNLFLPRHESAQEQGGERLAMMEGSSLK